MTKVFGELMGDHCVLNNNNSLHDEFGNTEGHVKITIVVSEVMIITGLRHKLPTSTIIDLTLPTLYHNL